MEFLTYAEESFTNYYKRDYQPIGDSNAKFELDYENTIYDGASQVSVYNGASSCLYNGNYGYDPAQNRVVKARIDSLAADTTFTYYYRDAQGNVMGVYTRHQDTLTWQEQHLYGSSRLGLLEPNVVWTDSSEIENTPYFATKGTLFEGWKRYELSNHFPKG